MPTELPPRRFLVVLAVWSLVVALLAAVGPAASAGTTPRLAVRAPAQAQFGSTVAVKVAVRRGAPRQRVVLERKSGASWVRVAARRLPRVGRVKKVAFRPGVTWSGARQFRVVLVPKGATRGVRGAPFAVTALARTWLVSHDPSGQPIGVTARRPSVSADGRFVVFESTGDFGHGTTGPVQVYLWDRVTDTVTLVSHDAAGNPGSQPSFQAVISADGAYVAFSTSANLDAADNGLHADVYRWRRSDDSFAIVSKVGATLGNNTSSRPSISADGNHIAFESDATNLGGGSPGNTDVFLWDSGAPALTLVSHGPAGAATNGASVLPSISADGDHVAFESRATNVADPAIYTGGDPNGDLADIFLWDRSLGTTLAPYLVSTGPTGLAAANSESRFPSVSGDGRYVAFDSFASNLSPADPSADRDVFVWDREHLVPITTVTDPAGSYQRPSISQDGSRIAFVGTWLDLNGQGNSSIDDVIVWDRATDGFTLVSQGPDNVSGDDDSEAWNDAAPAMSADGRWVAFDSDATNLAAGVTDAGSVTDVFLRGPLG